MSDVLHGINTNMNQPFNGWIYEMYLHIYCSAISSCMDASTSFRLVSPSKHLTFHFQLNLFWKTQLVLHKASYRYSVISEYVFFFTLKPERLKILFFIVMTTLWELCCYFVTDNLWFLHCLMCSFSGETKTKKVQFYVEFLELKS